MCVLHTHSQYFEKKLENKLRLRTGLTQHNSSDAASHDSVRR